MAALSRAVGLLHEAQNLAKKKAGWFGRQDDINDEAGDAFQKAANQFKLEQRFEEAGKAFEQEALCREKNKQTHEASNAWWSAAKAYKQVNPDKAIECLTNTIKYLTTDGKFRQAADREKEVASIHAASPDRPGNLRQACESYERAGDWYAQEDATATAQGCWKTAADLYADINEYKRAIQLYERIADGSLESSITKYNVKEYWLRAGLCAVASQDTIAARRQYESYAAKDVTFASTREAKFLLDVIDTYEAEDLPAFTQAMTEMDRVIRFDNWKVKILVDIQKAIQSAEEDEGMR